MGTIECSQPASKSSWDSQDFGDISMVLKMAHFRKSTGPRWVKGITLIPCVARDIPDKPAQYRYCRDIYYMYMCEGYIRSRLPFGMTTQLCIAIMLNASGILQRTFEYISWQKSYFLWFKVHWLLIRSHFTISQRWFKWLWLGAS